MLARWPTECLLIKLQIYILDSGLLVNEQTWKNCGMRLQKRMQIFMLFSLNNKLTSESKIKKVSSIKLASFNESKVAPTRWSNAFTRPKNATIQLLVKQKKSRANTFISDSVFSIIIAFIRIYDSIFFYNFTYCKFILSALNFCWQKLLNYGALQCYKDKQS